MFHLLYHTIRKVKFLSKNFNFDKTLQFFSANQSCQQLNSANPKHFHEFSPKIFLTIFFVNSKLSTAKKVQNRSVFTSFHPKTIRQFFSGNQSWNFWTKNEDFEQCVVVPRPRPFSSSSWIPDKRIENWGAHSQEGVPRN